MTNLIPVSRKEQYLSKIDGMTNKSPDKTYTKEEYFFSEILGEALHKPVLETRYEMYLAKIAGREIGIPYPETRLERFLAKAAGMNISVPTPITREEMYWSTYSPFYLSNSSGTSPLTYGKCKIGTLKNYRIYGQTVDGESVGDRTGNLFDAEIVQGSFNANNGAFRDATNRIRSNESDFIYLTTGTYTINADGVDDVIRYAYSSEDTSTFLYYLSETSWQSLPRTFTVQTPCYFLFGFRLSDESDIIPSDISNIMLNTGSTALPYEPYGYKVPMTVEGKNLLQNTATSQTIEGLAVTVNSDKSISLAFDSASFTRWLLINSNVSVTTGCILNGCPNLGINGLALRATSSNSSNSSYASYYVDDTGTGVLIDDMFGEYGRIQIRIPSNYANSNLTFYPMIRKADIEDDTYEPYHAPITTSIYLPEPIKMVGDEAEYVDYAEQKQHRVRKNLLQNTAISKTTATGLTITVNSDKSVIVDGTTNDGKASGVVLGGNTVLGKGTFIISGCPEGGDKETYRLVCVINDGGTQKIAIDSGDGNSVTLTSDDATIINNGFYLAVKSCDNKTFYPMIRKADIEDDTYEPYIENTEVDVTLPALPTLPGTNVLSVGTEVQPSHIFAEFDKEREYG